MLPSRAVIHNQTRLRPPNKPRPPLQQLLLLLQPPCLLLLLLPVPVPVLHVRSFVLCGAIASVLA
jgi:hypothetical protein